MLLHFYGDTEFRKQSEKYRWAGVHPQLPAAHHDITLAAGELVHTNDPQKVHLKYGIPRSKLVYWPLEYVQKHCDVPVKNRPNDKINFIPKLYDEFLVLSSKITGEYHKLLQDRYWVFFDIFQRRPEFGEYNLLTQHGRPMSEIQRIPKNERHIIIPKKDWLVSIDFRAFVFESVARYIGYKFNGYPYDDLGMSKDEAFVALFGNKKSRHPFFQMLDEYKDSMVFPYYLNDGSSSHNFHSFTTQLETFTNTQFIKNILFPLFPDSVVIYIFDEVILDLTEEQLENIPLIKSDYPMKIKIGRNWGKMDQIVTFQ